MFYAGAVFAAGWALRCASSYQDTSLDLFIAQSILIYTGPPIYAAAEYNILGRLMHYLPMHAPLNPNRLIYVFIYLGAIVEGLTAAGAARIGAARKDKDLYNSGANLIKVSLVLQIVVEGLFMGTVTLLHYRCRRNKIFPRNVRMLCIMLYGTSSLIVLRCVFRAVEAFAALKIGGRCSGTCEAVSRHEWYLYALEAAPMVLYTLWINVIHPGTLLPRKKIQYLDADGKTERIGPGWADRRSVWLTFVDPFDLVGFVEDRAGHDKFWELPEQWPLADGSFAQGTATNVGKGSGMVKGWKLSKQTHKFSSK